MQINQATREEVSRQVVGLMADHEKGLQSAFSANGQEVEATFKVVIKSENPAMDVKTDISFLPYPKVKDSAHGRVSPMPLFDENPHDRRTRIHTKFMVHGVYGEGQFEKYLRAAA